jgi:hypothetical protein
MATLATTEDFEVRHGPLVGDEADRVEALLEDASALIGLELAGSEADWLKDEPEGDVPAGVKAVCIQVAYRAWANPDSVAREELGAVARTYRGTDQSDALWLTQNEARLIRKAAGTSSIASIPVETPFSGDPEKIHPMDFWPLDEAS